MSVLSQTAVEKRCDALAIKVLTDNHELDHTVAIFRVPVAHHVGIVALEHLEVLFGRGGKPEPGLSEPFLHSGLLEEIRHVGIIIEVAYTFGAYDVLGPFFSYEPIEFIYVKRFTSEIYESADAIFFGLAFTMMMMVMMTMFMLVMVMFMVVLVLMVMFIIFMVVLMVMMVVMLMLIFIDRLLDFLNPGGGSHCLFKIEQMCVEHLVKIEIAVIRLYNVSFMLKGTCG